MNIFFTKLIDIDRKVSDFLTRSKKTWIRTILKVLTHLGDGAVWIIIYTSFLIFFKDYFYQIILTLIGTEIIGLCIIIILRYATKTRRPDLNYKVPFYAPWNKYSFPSHHSLRSFMIAVIIGKNYPDVLPFLLLIALIISFSRIYLSKHYLSDVLAGALIGVLLANVPVNALIFK